MAFNPKSRRYFELFRNEKEPFLASNGDIKTLIQSRVDRFGCVEPPLKQNMGQDQDKSTLQETQREKEHIQIIGLNGLELIDINLNNTDLTNCHLNKIITKGITGKPILPKEYTIQNGYIIGPGVDLSGADLKEMNFVGLNLNNVIFNQTNLDKLQIPFSRRQNLKRNKFGEYTAVSTKNVSE